MSSEPFIPPSLVRIAAHFECDWDAQVETIVDGALAIARRAKVFCRDHSFEIGSVEVDRHGPVPSKEYLDEAIIQEIGRRALVETMPEQMRDLSSAQIRELASNFIHGSLERWGNS